MAEVINIANGLMKDGSRRKYLLIITITTKSLNLWGATGLIMELWISAISMITRVISVMISGVGLITGGVRISCDYGR